jgi:hypothetical protein
MGHKKAFYFLVRGGVAALVQFFQQQIGVERVILQVGQQPLVTLNLSGLERAHGLIVLGALLTKAISMDWKGNDKAADCAEKAEKGAKAGIRHHPSWPSGHPETVLLRVSPLLRGFNPDIQT